MANPTGHTYHLGEHRPRTGDGLHFVYPDTEQQERMDNLRGQGVRAQPRLQPFREAPLWTSAWYFWTDVKRVVRNSPLTIGVAGLAAGFLIARGVRALRRIG